MKRERKKKKKRERRITWICKYREETTRLLSFFFSSSRTNSKGEERKEKRNEGRERKRKKDLLNPSYAHQILHPELFHPLFTSFSSSLSLLSLLKFEEKIYIHSYPFFLSRVSLFLFKRIFFFLFLLIFFLSVSTKDENGERERKNLISQGICIRDSQCSVSFLPLFLSLFLHLPASSHSNLNKLSTKS